MKKNILACLLVSMALSACATNTSVRQHPQFANQWSKHYSFAILPPEAKITLVQFSESDERMSAEEKIAMQALRNEIPKIFMQKGYQFRNVDFDTYFKQYPDINFQHQKLREAVESELAPLYKEKTMAKEAAFKVTPSVGPLANVFSEASGADLLVIAYYVAFEKSGGMVAKDVTASILFGALTGLMPVSPTEGAVLQVAVIDGTTGAISWTNMEVVPSLSSGSNQATILAKFFEELPNKSQPKPKN